MEKKQMLWKTKGMNKDLSVSAFNPEFAFENMNLRLSTNEHNTLLSWVNEKGTEKIDLYTKVDGAYNPANILGAPIGTAVIDHQLVVFTTSDSLDYIYTIHKENAGKMILTQLYSGHLNFSTSNPLETLVSYEMDTVEKVYWVDGRNQPRVINIKGNIKNGVDTQFDFVPELALNETVTVEKLYGGGRFAPGVIQYSFTYVNKYGQESNIFYTTPLYYVSFIDRAGSPEEMVDNAFKITVTGLDSNFDYLRIYSIQRTSLNGVPYVKRLQDIDISVADNSEIFYVDTGLTGDTVDPTELLYKGGNSTIPSSIEQKDNTLFFGNLQLEETYIGGIEVSSSPTITYLKDAIKNTTVTCTTRSLDTKLASSGSYTYYNQLNGKNCAGFKKDNYYRLGVQFQYKTGKWSEPLFINDVQQEIHFTSNSNILSIPVFKGTLSQEVSSALLSEDYKKARAVVVYPNQNDRVVICQGVVAPTVYTQEHRKYTDQTDYIMKGNDDLYAQSSWVFRTVTDTDYEGHYNNIGTIAPTLGDLYYAERGNSWIESGLSSEGATRTGYISGYTPNMHKQIEIQGCYEYYNKFKVDQDFLTFHSPDVEFDTNIYYIDLSNVKLYDIGKSEFTHTLSDISIQTESPTISNIGSGIIHKSFDDTDTYGIISGLFYDDFAVDDVDSNFAKYSEENNSLKWMVYLWNKTGSLNNDVNRPAGKGTASAILKKKKISNLRFATTIWNENNTEYQKELQGTPQLFASDQISIVKVDGKIYQGNVDTVLTPNFSDGQYFAYNGDDLEEGTVDTPFTSTSWWKTFSANPDVAEAYGFYKYQEDGDKWKQINGRAGNDYLDLVLKRDLVRMKYKSTAHIPFMLNGALPNNSFTWIPYTIPVAEFRRRVDTTTIFGGQSEDALKANTWIPCGEPVALNPHGTEIEYSYGDTYYQRYDCLKTYAFTPEDENQVIEIGSFMLETYVNIEGRYDRNRGQKSNVDMSPLNFNLHNPVYSQQDNFFTYKIVNDESSVFTYPNQVTWSLTKTPGADVDAWTNMSLGSTLELDGDKGSITKLIKLNDRLLAFQDSGISQIMYNENVQVSTEQGVPIEIANSGKVQGARYLSNTVGCSNKWSVVQTPSGIYFMDSNDKSIYLLGDGLKNITEQGGFNTWAKQNISTYKIGEPLGAGAFKAFYDRLNQEVLYINKDTALAWSEKIGAFTSFYDYGNAPYFVNLDDEGYWLNISQAEPENTEYKLWKHQGGEYCNFFDINKDYYTVLIGNPQPQADKIFTNLEFRACVGDGESQEQDSTLLPFDSLETWNEYQHGETKLHYNRMPEKHFQNNSNALNRKFRIWRCDIPRDGNRKLDRMRNPWLYLKLMKDKAGEGTLPRVEIHDVGMNYFV